MPLVAALAFVAACGGSSEPEIEEGRSNVAELIKQDDTVGGGNEAAAGRRVTVHYTGWLYNESAADKKGTQVRQLARPQRAVRVQPRRAAR